MLRLATLSALLCLAAVTAAAESFVRAPEAGYLNLRAAPSAQSDVLRELPDGTPVTVLERPGRWSKVQDASGVTGWVTTRHIVGDPNAAPVIAPAGPRATSAPVPSLARAFVDAPEAGALNLRAGPSTRFAVVRTMPHGAPVQVLNRSEGWARLRDENGATGWASERYLAVNPRSAPAPQRRDPTPIDATRRAWVDAPEAGGLNLRSGPSTRYAVLREMPHGSPVEVLSRLDDWTRLRDETGATGWASARYLSTAEPLAPVAIPDFVPDRAERIETLYVNAPSAGALNLRRGPGTRYDIVDTMPQGSAVQVLAGNGTWRYIRHESGQTGFAHVGFLSDRPIALPEPEPEPIIRPERPQGPPAGVAVAVDLEDLPFVLLACAGRPSDQIERCVMRQLGVDPRDARRLRQLWDN